MSTAKYTVFGENALQTLVNQTKDNKSVAAENSAAIDGLTDDFQEMTQQVTNILGEVETCLTELDEAKADIEEVNAALATKQDSLTFDTTPTNGSTNPVTSGGVYTALAGKSGTGHTHTNYASTVTTTGTGNAITSISQSGNTITATKGSTFLTAHPTVSKSTDSTNTATPGFGGTFTAVDSVTRDTNGHVTKINTKTVTVPNTAAGTALGLVKSGGDVTISNGVITVNDDSHNHTIANVDGLQTALNGKETSGAAATALADAKTYTDEKISDLINSAPTTLDTLGEIATAMEENADVVEALEQAIGNKSDVGHTHNYAGSSSAGGAATSANKLNTNAGSATNPVYFENGVPVKTTHTLGASVPSGAKFTDTTYSTATSSTLGLVKIGYTENGKNYPVELSNGQMFVNVPWTDNNTTYDVVSTTAAGLAPKRDGSTTKFLRGDGTWAVPPDTNTVYTHPSTHPASMITGLATVATSGSYNDLTNKPTIPAAVTVDSALSSTSTNPVQNKVINSALAGKADSSHTHSYLPLSGGTVTGNITFDNSASAQSGEPNLKWGTRSSNTPYIGFASDQTDGTFLLGSLKGTTYATGLAIGGGSGNLLWKGVKVATTADIPTVPTSTINDLVARVAALEAALANKQDKISDWSDLKGS